MVAYPSFDFVPPGIPPIINENITTRVKESVPKGLDAITWEVFVDEQVEEIKRNGEYIDTIRNVYQEAGVNLICPTVWSTDPRLSYREGTYRDITRWTTKIEAIDWMHKVSDPETARRVATNNEVGIILGTQNLGEFTKGDIEKIDELHNAGLRIIQLTYNKQNHIGAGCTEPSRSGLSSHGIDSVRKLNNKNAIIDLSHCNRETSLDAISYSRAPVAFTHSHCGALHDHPRAKSDEELQALAENDGYMGILVYPHQYEEPDFDTFFDHFEYASSVLGTENVGIATDWGITTPDVPPIVRSSLVSFFSSQVTESESGQAMNYWSEEAFDKGFEKFNKYSDRNIIHDKLEERGYSETEIKGYLGGNFLSFWDRVENY